MRLLMVLTVLVFPISSSAQTKQDDAKKQDSGALIERAGSCKGVSSGNQLSKEEVQTCVQIETARIAAAVGLPKTAQQLICTAPLVVKLDLQTTCKAESAAQSPPASRAQ